MHTFQGMHINVKTEDIIPELKPWIQNPDLTPCKYSPQNFRAVIHGGQLFWGMHINIKTEDIDPEFNEKIDTIKMTPSRGQM